MMPFAAHPRGRQALAALLACVLGSPALAQTPPGFDSIPRPPGSIGPPSLAPAGSQPGGILAPQAPSSPLILGPPPAQPAALPPPPAPAPPAPPPASTVPMVPAGQVALMVSARFGRDPLPITGGLHWRIYPDKPDGTGVFRLLREERAAAPIFVLPPGGYVVHVSFGLATAAKKVQLRSETVRESFELVAGGARFEGRVGDSRIPPGQITFDVFRGSQFEPGENKRPVAQEVATGDVVLLPEGTYYVQSNYGDGNAVVRSDIRVQASKLTDVTINHRAAVITLKLVTEKG